MAYKSAKKSAALSLKFLFWFLNLKVCYVSVIIVLVTHANLLVALPRKTILDMQQFCWQNSKLIEMDTKTMHAGTHCTERIKTSEVLKSKPIKLAWENRRLKDSVANDIMCSMSHCRHICMITKVQWENKIETQTPVHSEIEKKPD